MIFGFIFSEAYKAEELSQASFLPVFEISGAILRYFMNCSPAEAQGSCCPSDQNFSASLRLCASHYCRHLSTGNSEELQVFNIMK